MTVCGYTKSLKAEVLPELKLTGHKYKKKNAKATHKSSYAAFTFHIYNLGSPLLAAAEDKLWYKHAEL
jgi:hypothetical protein